MRLRSEPRPSRCFRGGLVLLAFLWASNAAGAQSLGPEDLFQRLQTAFSAGRWAESVTLGRQFSQAFPLHALAGDSVFLTGVSLFRSGQSDEAAAELTRFDRQFPQHSLAPQVRFWRGRARLQSRSFDAALEEFGPLLRGSGELLAQSLYYAGEAARLAGRRDEARRHWGRFLEGTTPPDQRWAVYERLAELDRQDRRWQGALTWSETLFSQTTDSELRQRAAFWAAWSAQELGQTERALRLWARYQDLNPTEYRAASWVALARLEAGREAWAEALRHFRRLDSDFPRAPETATLVSEAAEWARRLERWTEAADLMERQARTLGAGAADPWLYNAARARQKAGDAGRALNLLEPLRRSGAVKEEAWRLSLELVPEGDRPEWWARALEALEPGTLWQDLLGLWASHEHSRGSPARRDLRRRLLDRALALPDRSRREDWLWLKADLPSWQELSQGSGPRRRAALYEIGRYYLNRREALRAEGFFFRVLEGDHRDELHQQALLSRGLCFFNVSRWADSAASFERLLRESPASPWAGQARALAVRARYEGRQYAAALELALAWPAAGQDSQDAQGSWRRQALWWGAQAAADGGQTASAGSLWEQLGAEAMASEERDRARWQLVRLWIDTQNWGRIGPWLREGLASGQGAWWALNTEALVRQADWAGARASLTAPWPANSQDWKARAWQVFSETARQAGRAEDIQWAAEGLAREVPGSPEAEHAQWRLLSAALDGAAGAPPRPALLEAFFRAYPLRPSLLASARRLAVWISGRPEAQERQTWWAAWDAWPVEAPLKAEAWLQRARDAAKTDLSEAERLWALVRQSSVTTEQRARAFLDAAEAAFDREEASRARALWLQVPFGTPLEEDRQTLGRRMGLLP